MESNKKITLTDAKGNMLISIESSPVKSQEGVITVLGTITAVYLGIIGLGVIFCGISNGIESSKVKHLFKKALSQLTPDEKNKVVEIVKSDLSELVEFIRKDVDTSNKELLKALQKPKYKNVFDSKTVIQNNIQKRFEKISNASKEKDGELNKELLDITKSHRRNVKGKNDWGGIYLDEDITVKVIVDTEDYDNPDSFIYNDSPVYELEEEWYRMNTKPLFLQNNMFGCIDKTKEMYYDSDDNILHFQNYYTCSYNKVVLEKKLKLLFDKMNIK